MQRVVQLLKRVSLILSVVCYLVLVVLCQKLQPQRYGKVDVGASGAKAAFELQSGTVLNNRLETVFEGVEKENSVFNLDFYQGLKMRLKQLTALLTSSDFTWHQVLG